MNRSPGLHTKFVPSIDFKNLSNIIINVGGPNQARNVSLIADTPSIHNSQSTTTQPEILPKEHDLSNPAAASLSSDQAVSLSLQIVHPSHLNPVPRLVLSAPVLPCHPSSNQPVTHPTDLLWQRNQLSPDKIQRYRIAARYLFERPCFKYLETIKQCETKCSYNHVLPSDEKIFTKMNTFQNEKIQFIYEDFVVKYRLTFYQCFPYICRLYGERRMPQTLFVSLVKDCEKYERCDFFKYIFKGQLQCQIDSRDALMLIVNSIDTACRASIDGVLEIIDEDPQSFIDILCRLATVIQLNPLLVKKLLNQVSENANLHQLAACINLLKIYGDGVCYIEPGVFQNFCQIAINADPNLTQQILDIMNN